jgi:hypothetical protein
LKAPPCCRHSAFTQRPRDSFQAKGERRASPGPHPLQRRQHARLSATSHSSCTPNTWLSEPVPPPRLCGFIVFTGGTPLHISRTAAPWGLPITARLLFRQNCRLEVP